jgi:hypothetical protein
VLVVAAGITNSASGAVTNPSSYSLNQTLLASRGFLWSLSSASALNDERATWLTGSSVLSGGVIASFKATGGGGGSFVDNTPHILNCLFASA